MRVITTLCFSLIFCGMAFSQNYDQRLFERYSEREVKELYSTDKDQYDILVYALDNGIYFVEKPDEKSINAPSLSIQGKELNYISLGLEIADQNQYFEVEDGRLLVLKSNWVLNHEMKKQ